SPPSNTRSVIRAIGSRFVARANTWRMMSADPASTAPTKSSTVSGFKPSVVIALLLDLRWTRRPQRCGLTADERARAGATPVPGPPVDVFRVPALEQAVHHEATILLVQLRQGGE